MFMYTVKYIKVTFYKTVFTNKKRAFTQFEVLLMTGRNLNLLFKDKSYSTELL